MKEAYYFSHDDNARNDIKIRAMRKRYGMAGYGRYWVVIELLRSEAGHRLPHAAFTFISLADEFGCDEAEAKKFIEDLINTFQLLNSDEEFFWSESLIRRMDKKEAVRQKRKEAAKKRWKSNANAMQKDANALQNDAKEKKRKEKKGKEIKGKERESNAHAREELPDSEKKPDLPDSDSFQKKVPPKKSFPPDDDGLPQWMKVANEMAEFFQGDGANQWSFMCDQAGGHIDPIKITTIWAGKHQTASFVLANWRNHTGKLTNWIKNELKTTKPRRAPKDGPPGVEKINADKYDKYRNKSGAYA